MRRHGIFGLAACGFVSVVYLINRPRSPVLSAVRFRQLCSLIRIQSTRKTIMVFGFMIGVVALVASGNWMGIGIREKRGAIFCFGIALFSIGIYFTVP